MFLCTPIFLGTALATFILGRALGLALPPELYFTFESFLFDRSASTRYFALVLKLLAPIAGGFLAHTAVLWKFPPHLSRQQRMEASDASLFAGGFAAAFISAWPFILYWDIFAAAVVRDQQAIYLVAYVLYFASFGYFALLGGQLAKVANKSRLPGPEIASAQASIAAFEKWRSAAMGSATTVAATAFATLFGHGK